MKSIRIGFVAVIICVLLLSQVSSISSASNSTSDNLSMVSSESLKITSFENDISESSLSATGSELVVPQGLGTVVIVVENSLYSSISVAVTQYRQDLNDTGYHTILYTNA